MNIKKWLFKEARWYQFWLPQSNVTGGLICGTILFVIVVLVAHYI